MQIGNRDKLHATGCKSEVCAIAVTHLSFTARCSKFPARRSRGVTLIELIVFIVVISLALGALLSVYNQSIANSVDPIVRVRLLELAQSQLDEIQARKYDENTPEGGVPACDSRDGNDAGINCAGSGLEGEDITDIDTLDDVDDFDGFSSCTQLAGYTCIVTVTEAGTDLGLAAAANDQAKRIQVQVRHTASGEQVTLSSYRANF